VSTPAERKTRHRIVWFLLSVIALVAVLIYSWIVGHTARRHEEWLLFGLAGVSVLFGLHRIRYSQARGFPVGGLVFAAYLVGLAFVVIKIF
jgi:hypothetical protein